MDVQEPLNYTINETCALLPAGRTSVYALVKNRELTLLKLGEKSLITAKSIHALQKRLIAEAEAKRTP